MKILYPLQTFLTLPARRLHFMARFLQTKLSDGQTVVSYGHPKA